MEEQEQQPIGRGLDQSESDPRIIKIPREPAVVMNEIPTSGTYPYPSPSLPESMKEWEAPRFGQFGEWMEGREVRKVYQGRYQEGMVGKYEPKTGWYRVVYREGQWEDVEWEELEGIVNPIDVSVSLRSLASRVARRGQKKGVGKGRYNSSSTRQGLGRT
ncbi:hypothetical protein MLD38_029885 [Melastoma candidum]|uniref:Uncharacterized protein n=1 Tax=Melastoma candidum TaxID=119954 RepID=A0ACB9NAL9_9MYRT|nr:hypothetical protein MLD38_029885 [Melastoma candidum]